MSPNFTFPLSHQCAADTHGDYLVWTLGRWPSKLHEFGLHTRVGYEYVKFFFPSSPNKFDEYTVSSQETASVKK